MKLFQFALGLMLSLTRREKAIAFYQNGFIVIDLDRIRRNPNLDDMLLLIRYTEWILRHEIGHALFPEATEKGVEQFAKCYRFPSESQRYTEKD
jgi:hypothetical protein